MEALRVVPVHPTEGGELEILDRLPRPGPGRPADEFGLVVPVHRLGQGIVIRVAGGADRGGRAGLSKTLGVADGDVLNALIAVVREPGDGLACVIAGPDAHLERVQREVRPQRLRQLPADHAAGEHVDDERGIHPAGEGAAVGDVRDPQLVRSGRGELPLHQIRVSRGRRIRPGRLHPFRAPCALDPCHLHQPRGLVAADRDPRPPGRLPELADPVDPVVRLPQLDEPRDQLLVPLGTGGRGAGLSGVVAARSHLQLSADELDSEPATVDEVVLVRVDERDYFR